MDSMICIYRTDNITKADLIRSELESAGIETYLKSNDAGGVLPQLRMINPVEIYVHHDDLEVAKEILEERK